MPQPANASSTAAALEDFEWLIGSDAAELLTLAATYRIPLTAQVAQLRGQCLPARTHLVLEQVALRAKARAKFTEANRMFFTARGLEQATDEIVADYKASRFPLGAQVLDLCCGIGGDLLALARRGETGGLDRDPVMALLARVNGRAAIGLTAGVARVPDVVSLDVSECDIGQCAAWHIDPDRRPLGRRTTHVELHEPGSDVIDQLLARNPHAAIKLAPAAELPPAWSAQAELEWISRGRECRQLVAWFGQLARHPGRRSATVLGSDFTQIRTIVETDAESPPVAQRIERYLLEPDAAVLAAKLGGTLAAEHGLAALTPGSAYWTSDRAIVDPALGCFEVQEVLPFRIKPLKALLRSRRIGRLEIKKRGVELDPAELRKQLALAGDEAATLLVARIGKRVIAILARRVA